MHHLFLLAGSEASTLQGLTCTVGRHLHVCYLHSVLQMALPLLPRITTSDHHFKSHVDRFELYYSSFSTRSLQQCWRRINALTTGINATTSVMTIIPVTTSNHWHHQCNDPARPGSTTTSVIPAWQLNKTTLVNEATALVVVLNRLLVQHDTLAARLHQRDPGDMAIELVVNNSGQ